MMYISNALFVIVRHFYYHIIDALDVDLVSTCVLCYALVTLYSLLWETFIIMQLMCLPLAQLLLACHTMHSKYIDLSCCVILLSHNWCTCWWCSYHLWIITCIGNILFFNVICFYYWIIDALAVGAVITCVLFYAFVTYCSLL